MTWLQDSWPVIGLLILSMVGLLALRSRSRWWTFGAECTLLLVFVALLAARGTSPIPAAHAIPAGAAGIWTRILAVAWWLIAARALSSALIVLLGHDGRTREARLVSDLLSAAIHVAAVLIILNSVLNLPVNGLLATSGVLAIVLGLALQNTLADVFSGIAVGLEQPFHVGDRISIKDLIEGVVVQVNWRAIRIRTDGEDLATIPNSIVAKAQILNRSVPTERRSASLEVIAPAQAMPDHIIMLLDHAIMLSSGLLTNPAPSITMTRLGLKTSTYAINYFVPQTSGMAAARNILLQQVRRQFYHAGLCEGGKPTPMDTLGRIALFETLTAEQITGLARHLTRHTLEQSDTLFEQGSSGASLFVVAEGVLEISRHVEGEAPHRLGRIGVGEYIGEISLLTGDPRPVTVTAVTDAVILELPHKALEAPLAETAELGAALERSVMRGLDLLHRDVAARAIRPLDEKGALFDRIRHFFRLPA
jgi:small-conductance mechanosensitive channel/CRP-like cAMP-binding protein